eukprot:scaffold218271_cov36-Tisochrysis_lutea.AAC.3
MASASASLEVVHLHHALAGVWWGVEGSLATSAASLAQGDALYGSNITFALRLGPVLRVGA